MIKGLGKNAAEANFLGFFFYGKKSLKVFSGAEY